MDNFPVEPKRRKIVNTGIRVIDIIIYLVVFAGGVYALWFTPKTVTQELHGWEWLIPWWSAFLLVGGLLGFVGRLTTIWILEPAAGVAASVGILIYLVVLTSTAFTSITSAVAACLVFVALLAINRRYFELQLFGSDPSRTDFKSRFADSLARRTRTIPPRG